MKHETLFSGVLTPSSIDDISELLVQSLREESTDDKEILRLRLTSEEVLGIWKKELGEQTPCELVKVRRFGKTSFLLSCTGRAVNPVTYRDELMLSVTSHANLAVSLGLPAGYAYSDGRNELKISVPGKKDRTLKSVLMALLLAVVFGILFRLFIPGASPAILSLLVDPFSDVITNLLRLICGPLVFLSVLCGITSLGSGKAMADIGGTLSRRFGGVLCTLALLFTGIGCLFVPATLSSSAETGSAFSEVLGMVYDIIPDNLITPFESGNTLQIIFLGISCGIACTLLGTAVSGLTKLLEQLSALIMLLMTGVAGLVPLYIFLSIFGLILRSDTGDVLSVLLPLLIIHAACILLPFLYAMAAARRTGMPLAKVLRGLLPAYLISLSTASSTAALSTSVECCQKKLGIDANLSRIGVTFGQILFCPGSLLSFVVLALFMAVECGIAVTPKWLFFMILTSLIESVATPPIPGGGLAAITLLYEQLGIPLSSVAVAAVILTLTDYTVTSCNVSCLGAELLIAAKKLGMLTKDKKAGE